MCGFQAVSLDRDTVITQKDMETMVFTYVNAQETLFKSFNVFKKTKHYFSSLTLYVSTEALVQVVCEETYKVWSI